MKKRTIRVSKKQKIMLIILAAVVVIGLAGATWYYLGKMHADQQAKIQKDRHTQAQQEVEKSTFRGDSATAVAFVEKVKAGQPEAAASVYQDKIATASDTTAKRVLYDQYITIANQYELRDQVLQAALANNKLQPSFTSLATVARAYEQLGNSDKQIDYLQQALVMIDQLPDGDNKTNFTTLYQSKIDAAQEKQ